MLLFPPEAKAMFGRALEELIVAGGTGSAARWISLIREAPQVKALKNFSDQDLAALHNDMGGELARWLTGSSDRNALGSFFAGIGKEYSVSGVSLSELSLALALARKATVRRLVEDGMFENSSAIYAMFDASERVADFYALGNYYMTKGFLESTIERITKETRLEKTRIEEFFCDDLFYKKTDR
jgi:hypothetical protein